MYTMTSLEDLGRLIKKKRNDRGVRAVAKEIGISHATLSRVERGFLPDLENYQKICKWLGVSVDQLPVTTSKKSKSSIPRVHFRKQPTVSAETAQALAQLILTAQAAINNNSQE
jgi:transcriptional regulator with XRE-family HTH domain